MVSPVLSHFIFDLLIIFIEHLDDGITARRGALEEVEMPHDDNWGPVLWKLYIITIDK